MKVKRSSWHYKLYCVTQEFWRGDGPFFLWEFIRGKENPYYYNPKSLCSYFWATVLSCIAIPILSILILLCLLVLGIVFVIAYPFLRCKKRFKKNSTVAKQPNLAISYIKAKKNRVCPLIELVDE